jgi:hypothetical protein
MQKYSENFTALILGIKEASFSLIILQTAEISTRVLIISAGTIEGRMEGNRHWKVTKLVNFLHDNTSAHRALFMPEDAGLPGLPIS